MQGAVIRDGVMGQARWMMGDVYELVGGVCGMLGSAVHWEVCGAWSELS